MDETNTHEPSGGGEVTAQPDSTSEAGPWKRAASLLLATSLLLVLIEGGSSLLLAAWESRGAPPQKYSEYDPQLGWISLPSLDIPDMWGPGRSLHTNRQRVRARDDTPRRAPAGRIRALCSGDSFAFGSGVGNEETWCHLLSRLDPRLETVNIGQPGYGLGQALLRYRQDGSVFEHALHLFTFIDADFRRLLRDDSRSGRGKPILRVADDELTVENVPVPRIRHAISRAITRLAERLRSVDLALRITRRIVPSRDGVGARHNDVVDKVFREVHELGLANGSLAVFVYLPTSLDLNREMAWRAEAATILDGLGYSFIDLTDALREVPPTEVYSFFLPESSSAVGHYSARGNAWIGEELHRQLLVIEPAAELLHEIRVPGTR